MSYPIIFHIILSTNFIYKKNTMLYNSGTFLCIYMTKYSLFYTILLLVQHAHAAEITQREPLLDQTIEWFSSKNTETAYTNFIKINDDNTTVVVDKLDKNHTTNLTINETMLLALEMHPGVNVQKYKEKITSINAQTKGLFDLLPMITVKLNNINANDQEKFYVSLQATQTLFNSFRNIEKYKIAKHEQEIAHYRFVYEIQNILLNSIKAHMDVVYSVQVYASSEHNHQVLQKYVSLIKERFNIGEATVADVAQAESRRSLTKSEMIKNYSNLQIAKQNYQYITGESNINLTLPNMDDLSIQYSIDELLELVIKNNIRLKISKKETSLSKHNTISAFSDLLPSLDTTLSTNLYNDSDNTIDIQAILSLTIPILQKGRAYGGLQEAKLRENQIKYQQLEAEKSIKTELINTWHLYIALQHKIQAYINVIKSAQIALDRIKQEILLNNRTTLELLEAKQELFTSKVEMLALQRELVNTVYKLKYLTNDTIILK